MQGHGPEEPHSPRQQPALRRPGLRGDQAQSHHGHGVGERCPGRRGAGARGGGGPHPPPQSAAHLVRCAQACAPVASGRMFWARNCLVPHVEADFCGLSAGRESGAGMGFRSGALRWGGGSRGLWAQGAMRPRDGKQDLAEPGHSPVPSVRELPAGSPALSCPAAWRPARAASDPHPAAPSPDGGLGAIWILNQAHKGFWLKDVRAVSVICSE